MNHVNRYHYLSVNRSYHHDRYVDRRPLLDADSVVESGHPVDSFLSNLALMVAVRQDKKNHPLKLKKKES